MTIDVRIVGNEQDPNSVKVNVVDKPVTKLQWSMNVRKALNGDIMIFEHHDIDIMILVEKKKIVAFAKDEMSDAVYGAEKRLFDHLKKAGIVLYDSVEGGSVYGSLQGVLLESKEVDGIKMSLYEISKWIETERPFFDKPYDDMVDDAMLNPSEEDSTELGEVPHEEEKGSILQRGLFAPYLYGRYTY